MSNRSGRVFQLPAFAAVAVLSLWFAGCSSSGGAGPVRPAAVGGQRAVGAVDEAFRREGPQPTDSIFAPMDLPTPNDQRLGSGAPGPGYWQQRADYVIDARLDTQAGSVSASVRITYHNNSPHALDYLWLQLEQNLFRNDSIGTLQRTPGSVMKMQEADFDGGYTVNALTHNGQDLPIHVYDTLARVEIPAPIRPGERFTFSFDYSFVIPPHLRRMGSEEGRAGHHLRTGPVVPPHLQLRRCPRLEHQALPRLRRVLHQLRVLRGQHHRPRGPHRCRHRRAPEPRRGPHARDPGAPHRRPRLRRAGPRSFPRRKWGTRPTARPPAEN
jgi:hypothetical protein